VALLKTSPGNNNSLQKLPPQRGLKEGPFIISGSKISGGKTPFLGGKSPLFFKVFPPILKKGSPPHF